MAAELQKDKIQILLVDDEIDIIDLLCEELEDQGYQVLTALTADKAAELLEIHSPDVILCDYKMPKKNGLEVLKKAQEKPRAERSFLFYLVTGQSDLTESEALERGIHRCVAKPFDIFKLIDTIETDLMESYGRTQ